MRSLVACAFHPSKGCGDSGLFAVRGQLLQPFGQRVQAVDHDHALGAEAEGLDQATLLEIVGHRFANAATCTLRDEGAVSVRENGKIRCCFHGHYRVAAEVSEQSREAKRSGLPKTPRVLAAFQPRHCMAPEPLNSVWFWIFFLVVAVSIPSGE